MVAVLMGVSGSGKTTIGKLLAERVGAVFADADDYHSAANKAKMAAGHPLDDDDRRPWLETLHGVLQGWVEKGESGVMACSALKEAYRAILVGGLGDGAVRFVLLEGSKALFAARMAQRHHEFMNAGLLDSQFATLEVPEGAVRVVNDREPGVVVGEILGGLGG